LNSSLRARESPAKEQDLKASKLRRSRADSLSNQSMLPKSDRPLELASTSKIPAT
jgi:hypothetical protein